MGRQVISSYSRDSRSERNDLGRLIIEKGESKNAKNAIRDIISVGFEGHELMGIFYGDYERIDSVLRKADTISVRKETEQVGESDCFVIDANAGGGKYTVWIDPKHGYNIAKGRVQRENAVPYGRPQWQVKNASNSIDNVTFKKKTIYGFQLRQIMCLIKNFQMVTLQKYNSTKK